MTHFGHLSDPWQMKLRFPTGAVELLALVVMAVDSSWRTACAR
jgi:hypothetical protein